MLFTRSFAHATRPNLFRATVPRHLHITSQRRPYFFFNHPVSFDTIDSFRHSAVANTLQRQLLKPLKPLRKPDRFSRAASVYTAGIMGLAVYMPTLKDGAADDLDRAERQEEKLDGGLWLGVLR